MRLTIKNNLQKTLLLLATAAVVVLVVASQAFAQGFNQQINYQGKLATPAGVAVSDGTYSMVFRLYAEASGGTNIWSETQSVTVTDGLFSVMLGTSTSLASVDFSQTLYLGININADGEMTPRKILGAVPAAFEAGNAQTLDNIATSSFLRSDQADTMAASSASTLLTLQQNGAGDLLSLTDGTNSLFQVNNAGQVSIGTTTDLIRRLTVAGVDNAGSRFIDTTNNVIVDVRAEDFQGFIGTISSSDLRFVTDNTSRMTLTTGGALGIGTTTPSQRLTVSGGDALFEQNIRLAGALYDASGAAGTSGMILQTSGTSTRWVATSTLGIGSSVFTDGGDYTYLTSQTDGLVIGSTTAPVGSTNVALSVNQGKIDTTPNLVEMSETTISNAGGVYAAFGDYVLLKQSVNARIYDVSDVTAPMQVSTLPRGFTSLNAAVVVGDYVYTAVENTDIGKGPRIYDISNVSNPVLISPEASSYNRDYTDIAVSGGYAYLIRGAGAGGDMDVYDVSDPTAPREISTISLDGQGKRIVVQGNYAYIGDDDLVVYDISDPFNPYLVDTASLSGGAVDIAIRGRYLYTLNSNSFEGLVTFDISDPTNMTQVDSIDTDGGTAIVAAGDYLFMTGGSSGVEALRVFSVRDADSPVLVDTIPFGNTVQAGRIQLQGNYLHVVDQVQSNIDEYRIYDIGGLRTTTGEIGDLLADSIRTGLFNANSVAVTTGLNIGKNALIGGALTVTGSASSTLLSGNTNPSLIVESGYVGIGTTTPTQKLSVSGNLRLTGALYDANNSAGTNGMVLQTTATGTQWVATSSLGFGSAVTFGTDNQVPFMNAAGDDFEYSSGFTYNGTNLNLAVGNGIAIGGTRMFYAGATDDNIAIGQSVLGALTSGTDNTGVGDAALSTLTSGSFNTAVGSLALEDVTEGSSNVAFGRLALANVTTASNNTGIGSGALRIYSGTQGLNTALGDNAAYALQDGGSNVMIGQEAMYRSTTSSNSVVIGQQAGYGQVGQSNYSDVVIIGRQAGFELTSGSQNVFIGQGSGYDVTSGANNILLGYRAANSLTTGANNIVIGYDVEAPSNTGSNQLNIGNLLFGTGLDGTGATLSSGNIGIGTTTPSSKLSVAGDALFTGLITAQGTGTSTFSDNVHVEGDLRVGNSSLLLNDDSLTATGDLSLVANSTLDLISLGDQIVFSQPGPGTGITETNDTSVTLVGAQSGTQSFSHTVPPADEDRLLVVIVSHAGDSDGVSGVTYDGISMTNIPNATLASGGDTYNSAWYLVNPPVGSNTVAVTYSGSPTATFQRTAISFAGVNQSSPIGYANSVADATPSMTIVNDAEDYIVDFLTARNDQSRTPNAGQTTVLSYSDNLFISYRTGVANATVGWTGGGTDLIHSAFVIQPATGSVTERARFAASGNFGIGTSTPSQKLTVSGNLRLTGALYDSTNSGGTSGMVLQTTGSGTQWVATSSLGISSGSSVTFGTDNQVPFMNTAGDDFEYSSGFTYNGTNLNLAAGNGLSFGGTRYLHADATNDSIAFGEYAGATFGAGTTHNVALGFEAGRYASTSDADENNYIGRQAGYNNTGGTNNLFGAYAGYGNTGFFNNMLGQNAGAENTGAYNILVGGLAGYGNTGDYNVFIGELAGRDNEGDDGVFLGSAAGQNNTGSFSNLIGAYAGQNGTGSDNNLIGRFSGQNSTGSYNNILGNAAGQDGTGSYNNILGNAAGRNNTGSYSEFFGFETAGRMSASYTVAIGGQALRGGLGETYDGNAATTTNNTVIGYGAGLSAQTGADNNILLGYQAANSLTTGANNIIIGYNVEAPSNTGDNQLNIGNLIFGTGIDGINTTLSSGNIGIGTSNPAGRFTVSNENLPTEWEQVGSDLNLSFTQAGSMAALSDNRVAYIDGFNDDLRVYEFDGSTWSEIGTELNISGVTDPTLTSLKNNRVAYFDESNDDLRVYEFDGSTWSEIGTELNISGVSDPSITALSSSRIAFIDGTNDDLRVYEFDGSDWNQIGNDLNISLTTSPAITALSSNRVAYIAEGNDDLRVYEFDGSDWSQVGSNLNLGSISFAAVTSLGSNRIAYIDDNFGRLRVYDFDGDTWSQVGSVNFISAGSYPSIAALNANQVAYVNATDHDLRVYQFSSPTLLATDANKKQLFAVSDDGYTQALGLSVNDSLKVGVRGQSTLATSTPRLEVWGNSVFGGDVLPGANLVHNLGSNSARWKNLWAETLNVGTSTWSIFNGDDGRLAFSNAAEQAGTEMFSISNTGNIGIGTSTPSDKLHIVGSDVRQDFASGNAQHSIYATNNTTGRAWFNGIAGTGASERSGYMSVGLTEMIVGTESNGGSIPLHLMTNDINRMTITTDGNVGIGDTDPSGFESGTGSRYLEMVGTNGSTEINLRTAGNSTGHTGALSFSNDTYRTGFVRSVKTGSSALDGILEFGTSDGTANATSKMMLDTAGNLGIGTTTPAGRLSMQNTGVSGAGVVGIDQYLGTANSVASAVQYGNRSYFNAANTATTTIVGNMYRLADNTTFGNTVRGLEVQTNRGSNTQGENTALSGFARTFGVRGVTSGDAGGSFEPAGGFFETEGTTQGNAIRGYSDSITSATLLSLFQDTSAFTGTGLEMNFGNTTGSFNNATSKYIDFQNAGTSVFTVSAYGTTTIGDGTTNNMAGLQIGFGGICVDNDGSCTASTTGRISAVSYETGNSDLAENYFSGQSLETGEIVTMSGGLSVVRAEKDADLPVLGVVSTKPGLTMGYDDTSLRSGEAAYPIALTGRVPVKLSTENGPIKKGDQLMLSSLPGVAMKATGTGATIGIALEDFTETRMYSDVYLNQFGDDMVDPVYEPVVSNTDTRINDGCYYGGGNATGEEGCVPLVATTSTGQITEVNNRLAQESVAEQIQALKGVRSQTIRVDGKSVKVGQVVMFVQNGHRWVEETQLTQLQSLFATSSVTEVGDEEDETIFDRLMAMANNFVDGVLSITGLKADKVETQELCLDDVCVDAGQLRALLEASNNEDQPIQVIEVTPEPEEDDEPEPEPQPEEETSPEEEPAASSTEPVASSTPQTSPDTSTSTPDSTEEETPPEPETPEPESEPEEETPPEPETPEPESEPEEETPPEPETPEPEPESSPEETPPQPIE